MNMYHSNPSIMCMGKAMARHDPRMDLNLFRVLEAIHVHGGVSAAARALHLTQPAVTHALGRLRQALDDPLFVRRGNRLEPTDRTRAMMPAVQAHLEGLQACAQRRLTFDPARLDMQFMVGFRDLLESLVLPGLLARLEAQAPGVAVACHRIAPGQLERELASGQAHLIVDRPLRTGPAVLSRKLGEDELVVLLRKGHPLSSRMGAAAYLMAGHVALEGSGQASTLDVLLEQSGRFRRIRATCQQPFAAAQAVAASDLLLTVPRSFARQACAMLPLSMEALPIRMRSFPVMAYWHGSTDDDTAHSWFRQIVFEVFAEAFDVEKSLQAGRM